MRRGICLLLVLTAACDEQPPKDPGPAPAADYRAAIQTVLDRVLDERYRLDGSPVYRFAAPVRDRVPRWLFEPEVEGKPHSFGYCHGWRIDFWVTPSYVGYPEQPESQRMAFFCEGGLRGIFAPGGGNAPLGLDQWAATWIDLDWQPPAKRAPAPAGGR